MNLFTSSLRKEVFFDMFDKSVQNVHEGAKALLDLMEHYEDVPAKVGRIKDLEHVGDEITHQILARLAKTFVTPLDREDIQHVASRLDDILDGMDVAAGRLMLYRIQATTEDVRELSRVLVRATKLLVEAFVLVRDLKKADAILACCVEVHAEENEGDRLMRHALASLFDNGYDARDIIKWKDVYEMLENATDRCEDVADVLQTIVVKYA